MKKIIRINNTSKLEDIKKAAKRCRTAIEEGWESELESAKTAYFGMNVFMRIWHRYFVSIVSAKNKWLALKDAEIDYKWKYKLQYDFCDRILNKLEIVKSIDLDEHACKRLWLTDLWDKTTKISVD